MQDSTAAVYTTSLLTQHVFFSHTSPVHLCLPLPPSLVALTAETRSEGGGGWMHENDMLFALLSLLSLYFSGLSPDAYRLVPSLPDAASTVYAMKPQHGEQRRCQRSFGRRQREEEDKRR